VNRDSLTRIFQPGSGFLVVGRDRCPCWLEEWRVRTALFDQLEEHLSGECYRHVV